MCSKCPPPERVHASERLLRTRPTFSETVMVSVGVSKLGCTELLFCRAGGENKRCLLPPVARPGGLQWGGCSRGPPSAGFRGKAPGQGVRGRSPLKLNSFQPSEDRGTWQICNPVKYSVNCSNILLEKVFVSPLP